MSAIQPGQTTPTVLGQLALTRFINKAGLQPIGDNLFLETPASGTPQDGQPNTDGYGDLLQGILEQANVEAVTRDLRPDRRPARLRDERQGHHRRRPDAAGHLRHDALRRRASMIRIALLAPRRLRRSRRLPTLALPFSDRFSALAPLAAKQTRADAAAGRHRSSAEVVRIGDLVENAGAAANIAIFRAPDLGETGSVPVARVIEALRAARSDRGSTPAA